MVSPFLLSKPKLLGDFSSLFFSLLFSFLGVLLVLLGLGRVSSRSSSVSRRSSSSGRSSSSLFGSLGGVSCESGGRSKSGCQQDGQELVHFNYLSKVNVC